MSYIGYVLAVIATIGFGALFYGPIMGDVFAIGYGVDPNNKQQMEQLTKMFNVNSMAMTSAMRLFESCVIGHLSQSLGYTTTTDAGLLAGLFWFGFGFPLIMIKHSYNPRGINKIVLLFDLFYQFLHYVIITEIVVFFHNLS